MNTIILIPSFFIFLYTIFKLVKEDHVFFRRNIKLEHFFDYTFIATTISWIFLQIINEAEQEQMTVVVIIASMVLFLIAKYKKIPVGRFFDFFTLSFLTAIPLWYFLLGIFSENNFKIVYFAGSAVFLLYSVLFIKVLFPKIMNRTLKEGSLTVFFIIFYSLFSLFASAFNIIYNSAPILSLGNLLIVFMLLASIPLLVKAQN